MYPLSTSSFNLFLNTSQWLVCCVCSTCICVLYSTPFHLWSLTYSTAAEADVAFEDLAVSQYDKAGYGTQKQAKKSGKVQKILNLNISAGKETKQKQTKKRKKLTCRKDKPRGRPSSRKGKVVQNKANQQLKIKAGDSKLKKVCTESRRHIDNQHLVCFCGEMFTEPPTEPWIQCKTCKWWFHEARTAGEGPYGLICDTIYTRV